MSLHVKCRQTLYAGLREVVRQHVPDAMVPWSESFGDYQPADFTSPRACNQAWSDPWPLTTSSPRCRWNSGDDGIDRRSHTGPYQLAPYTDAVSGDSVLRPLNPSGRTGLCGRGVLGRWGPNHAADTLMTRWRDKRGAAADAAGVPSAESPAPPAGGERQLEVLAICRGDCGQWAVPGGMIDRHETAAGAAMRELTEEALCGTSCRQVREQLLRLSSRPQPTPGAVGGESDGPPQLFAGYVDDPRNTDNSWMETVAFLVHLDDTAGAESDAGAELALSAGSDASQVAWLPVSRHLPMYASHGTLLRLAAERLGACW